MIILSNFGIPNRTKTTVLNLNQKIKQQGFRS